MLLQSSAYPTNSAVTGARKEVSRVRVDQREIVLYTADRSLRSWRAKRLLGRRGYHFEVVRITNDGLRAHLKRLRSNDYRQTVPYLYVDDRPVGGWGDIKVLDGSGTLELLVRGEV
jgi:glutaredoxin 3